MTKVSEVVQTTSPIDVVHARLLPSWFNWYLVIREEQLTAQINIVRRRDQVLAALDEAGWEVRLCSTRVGIPTEGRQGT